MHIKNLCLIYLITMSTTLQADSVSGKTIKIIDANMNLRITQGRIEDNNSPKIIRYCIGGLEFIGINNKEIIQVIDTHGKPKICF